MTKEELVDRMSATLSLDEIRDQQILFIDSVFDFERISALIRTTSRQRKIDVVVVDYIQLCEISLGKNDGREREIATISRRLKKMAKSVRCPFVIGSQLNRESLKRGKPTLADMRESGAIEQDASVVMLLSKSEDEEETLIDIAKHRGGPIGELRMVLNGPKFCFEEVKIYKGDM
jgi:replicative DNA helicase